MVDVPTPPAHLWIPERVSSSGEDACDLAESAGLVLDPEQRLIVDALLSERADGRWAALEGAVIIPRQCGKALATSTPVLTPGGWQTMGDLEVDDQVFHPGGYPVRVTGTSPVMVDRDCYRVTTTDGRSLVCDAEHLWTVTDKRAEVSKAGRRWFATRTLTTKEMVAAGLSRYAGGGRTSVLDGKAYATNEYRFVLPTQEPIKTPDVAGLPIDPYLFGIWLGDGGSEAAELTIGDQDVSHYREAVERYGRVVSIGQDVRTGAWRIRVGLHTKVRDGFESRLRRLGVWGNKHVPDLYLTAGTGQREALLQGLLDSDGHAAVANGQVEFVSIRPELADAVLFLARSLGWRATSIEGRATLRGKDCGPKWSVRFTPKLSDPFRPFRLARKAACVRAFDGNKGRRTVSIRSIEPVPSIPVRCIKVDSPDGLFLAGRDLVATHNTRTLQAVVLADVFLFGADLVVWTAHLFNTAQEAFRDLEALITGAPHLSRRVKKIRHENGGESIELMNGARIAFMARSASAGRGLSGDRVILDEAFALEAAQMGALLPTLSARPNPQVVYASSAGHAKSDILRSVRDRGRRGGDPSLVYLEWCAPDGTCASELCEHLAGTRGCAADDPANWQKANPAMGTRIDPDYIAAERRALPAGEFIRERMGWWDEAVDQTVPIPLEEWDLCADRSSRITSAKIWALDVTPNGTKATIAVAGLRSDGRPHVELVESRPGTGWVVDRIVQLSREHQTKQIRIGDRRLAGVLIDPTGPAAELLPQFREFAVNPYIVTARDLAGACGGLQSAVRERGVVHIGQEQVRDALSNAVRRDIGDGGWGFARRKSEADISPIVAVAVALHGLRVSNTAKPVPLVAWS